MVRKPLVHRRPKLAGADEADPPPMDRPDARPSPELVALNRRKGIAA